MPTQITDMGAAQHTEVSVKGRRVTVPSVELDGKTLVVTGNWLRIARVHEED